MERARAIRSRRRLRTEPQYSRRLTGIGIPADPLGSADTLTVNDLTGTDVTSVGADLAGFDGTGDGAADSVIVNGTNGPDRVHVTSFGSQVSVAGLQPHVQISGSEPANDTLLLNTLDRDDSVTVDSGVIGLLNPIVDLGAGE